MLRRLSPLDCFNVFAHALLHNSAELRIGLQDYPGAYNELKEVVEQYPDFAQKHSPCEACKLKPCSSGIAPVADGNGA